MKEVSPSEFWIFWVLIIAARVYWKQGDVWMRSDPEGIEPVVDFTKNSMTKSRHTTIKQFMYRLFADESLKDTDPSWWVISQQSNRSMTEEKYMSGHLILRFLI